MLYGAYNFERNLNVWLTLNKWCGNGAVCDAGFTIITTMSPKQIVATTHFTSSLEVQEQVRICCRDPVNYDTTEYG